MDTTERLHFYFSLSWAGEGNGNPLQCSCLENPRDGGVWWAAVYGVAQSRIRLKWLSSSMRKKEKKNWPPKLVPVRVRPINSSTAEIFNPLSATFTPMIVHTPQPTVTLSRAALWNVKQKKIGWVGRKVEHELQCECVQCFRENLHNSALWSYGHNIDWDLSHLCSVSDSTSNKILNIIKKDI